MSDTTEPSPYRIVKRIVDSMGTYERVVAVEVCDTCGCVWLPSRVLGITHCPNYYQEDHP